MTVTKRLDTTLTGVRIDPERRTLKGVEKAEFAASLTGAELHAILARLYPNIPCRVELREGCIRIEASPFVRGARIRVEADAALEITNGTRLVLRLRKMVSGPPGASDAARRYIQEQVNPVLDLNSIGVSGRLISVRVRPDAITLRGEGDPGRILKF